MGDYLFSMESRLSPEQWNALLHIEALAAEAGLKLYLVGGAIRDLVAGFPIDNLDFTIEGKPAKVIKELTRERAEVTWHSDDLDATELMLPSGVMVSISAARSENQGHRAGRSGAMAAPATIIQDLRRRDFAMNAIGLSLVPSSRGLLLDPVNGLADIEKREIRTTSSSSFYEDPVRLFRAVRLRTRLSFSFDAKTATQFENAMNAGVAEQAAGAGLALELRRLGRERNLIEVLRALEKEKLLKALSPRLPGGVDWAALTKAAKASQTLAHAGLRAPSFPLFLHLLTRRLPAREKTQLARRLRIGAAEWNLPMKLEANAKKLAKEIAGKAGGAPAKLYQLLSSAPADLIFLLLTTNTNAKVQARLKTYLSKYIPLRASLPSRELAELKVPRESPRFQKILDSYFLALISGELRTPSQQTKYLARMAQETV